MALQVAQILVLAIEDIYQDKSKSIKKVDKGRKIAFRLYTTTKFEDVMQKIALNAWKIPLDVLEFDFLGTIVQPSDTLETLHIRDGDIITVRNAKYTIPASQLHMDFKQLIGSSYMSDFTLKIGNPLAVKQNEKEKAEEREKKMLSLDSMEEEGKDVDYQEIPVHRIILRSRSEKFRGMFDSAMTEEKLGYVSIPHHSPKIFLYLLEFLYTDNLATTLTEEDHLVELLTLADEYLVPRLVRLCEVKLIGKVNMENATDLFIFATEHHNEDLQAECQRFILDHYSEFHTRPEFLTLAKQYPQLSPPQLSDSTPTIITA